MSSGTNGIGLTLRFGRLMARLLGRRFIIVFEEGFERQLIPHRAKLSLPRQPALLTSGPPIASGFSEQVHTSASASSIRASPPPALPTACPVQGRGAKAKVRACGYAAERPVMEPPRTPRWGGRPCAGRDPIKEVVLSLSLCWSRILRAKRGSSTADPAP